MNTSTSRFTIATMTVAACAVLALLVAAPAQAQSGTEAVQRIEIVGQRSAPVQRIEIVGKRKVEPSVQRIEIVGQRQRSSEHVAAVSPKAPAL